ncbi:MAG: tRNA (adenosine(37)-N6)-dimethylallyltransferase MiaA [Myxococcota bacterium]
MPWVIAGPTASGKSALALALAQRTGGVIVCADSRQVYQGMQIGAASPSESERRVAPHYGYNVVPPEERYDAGRFLVDTDHTVASAAAQGVVPILVGGSGLYLRCWRHGFDEVPGGDRTHREALEAELSQRGTVALHGRLQSIDPVAAAAISPQDPVRIVRALEIHLATGRRPSELRTGHDANAAPRVTARWLLLEAETRWLGERIRARTEAMWQAGLMEEAVRLRERLGPSHPLLGTMGYEEALAAYDGHLQVEDAVARIAQRQRSYAKRQRTWFRKEPWWVRLPAHDPDLVSRALSVFEGELPGLQGPERPVA